MADTCDLTEAQQLALLIANNANREISAQDMRDIVCSIHTLIAGAGGGAASTTTFLISEPGPAETDTPGFFTDAGFTVAQLNAVLTGSSTPSVTWTIRFANDRTPAGGTEVVTGGTTTTSTTTGDEIIVFNNDVIPAGSWVWIETTAQSGTVGTLTVTVTPA